MTKKTGQKDIPCSLECPVPQVFIRADSELLGQFLNTAHVGGGCPSLSPGVRGHRKERCHNFVYGFCRQCCIGYKGRTGITFRRLQKRRPRVRPGEDANVFQNVGCICLLMSSMRPARIKPAEALPSVTSRMTFFSFKSPKK